MSNFERSIKKYGVQKKINNMKNIFFIGSGGHFKETFNWYKDQINNKMILRSGRMIGHDNVIIDFDEASREWKKNKQSMGLGMYRYTSVSRINTHTTRKR